MSTDEKIPGSSENISFVERFEKERTEWSQIIKDLSSRFREIENLIDLQVDLYSQRQVAVDYTQQLSTLQSRLKKTHLSEWQKIYNSLLINEDYRYSERERVRVTDEKTSVQKFKIDVLQIHVDYFKETVKTIDSMSFGIKHRIEIEDFKRGN